jgi:hypothetical protein
MDVYGLIDTDMDERTRAFKNVLKDIPSSQTLNEYLLNGTIFYKPYLFSRESL